MAATSMTGSPPKQLVTFAIIVSLTPLYYITRYMLNPQFFATASITWLTLTALIYALVLRHIIIPNLRSPLLSIPTSAADKWLTAHAAVMMSQPQGSGALRLMKEQPTQGLIRFHGLLHTRPQICVCTPELVMEVLNTRAYDWEKPGPARKFLSRILGQGLVNVEGKEHRAMRKTVQPAFSGRNIRDLVPIFWTKGRDFAAAVARKIGEGQRDGLVDIGALCHHVTLDIIGAAGVGKDFHTLENADNELAMQYGAITSDNRGHPLVFFLINLLFPQRFLQMWKGTVYGRVAKAVVDLRVSVRNLLLEKKVAMDMKTSEQKDIIAIIMKSGSFSDDYLVDQLLTFLAAGHDTTASALTWVSWLLAINPAIQARLREECQTHLGHLTPEQVTADTFEGMSYLSAVCSETLRLYPTVPITARIAIVDTQIGGNVIPKGTPVIIVPWAMNRLTSYWGPDAETFNPARWLASTSAQEKAAEAAGESVEELRKKHERGGATHPNTLLTFLYGPRSCVGQGFARAEMKAILAALVMRFEIVMDDPKQKVVAKGMITIQPKMLDSSGKPSKLILRFKDLGVGDKI